MSGDPLVALLIGVASVALGWWVMVRRSDLVTPLAANLGHDIGSRWAKGLTIWTIFVAIVCTLFGLGMLAVALVLVVQ
jgi:hypothetical protein